MADYEYIVEQGVIVPDTTVVQSQVQAEYVAAFGTDLDLTPSTPQGLLITVDTLGRTTVIRNNANLANQINPNIAGGVFLDAIMALTGSQRVASTPSTVTVNLTGAPGTVIPVSSQVQTAAGDLFEITADTTLDVTGVASAVFQSVQSGPIPAASGALNQIVTIILGWETATNPLDAILGSTQQSDQQARLFRRNTLALQGMSLPEAIISELVNTPGVTGKPVFRENYTDFTIVVDGITLLPHSIFVCVSGGTDLAVAEALNSVKSGGCNYNGSTTVTITDPYSGQPAIVKFDRPTIIPILVRATVINSSAQVQPVTAVRKAILDYANGLIAGEDGLVVGASVSPFELAGAVNEEVPGLFVQNMEISLASPINYVTSVIPILIFQQAQILEGSITVITL